MSSAAYWTLAGTLVVGGFITGFSVGLPFFFLGIALLALGPVRHRRIVFWPVLIAVIGFFVGFALVTPLGCTVSSTRSVDGQDRSVERSTTRCSNAIGIDYSGTGVYNPSQTPALIAGVALGTTSSLAALISIRSRRQPADVGT